MLSEKRLQNSDFRPSEKIYLEEYEDNDSAFPTPSIKFKPKAGNPSGNPMPQNAFQGNQNNFQQQPRTNLDRGLKNQDYFKQAINGYVIPAKSQQPNTQNSVPPKPLSDQNPIRVKNLLPEG
jgi:hypothetical protein